MVDMSDEPESHEVRALVEAYLHAINTSDIEGLKKLSIGPALDELSPNYKGVPGKLPYWHHLMIRTEKDNPCHIKTFKVLAHGPEHITVEVYTEFADQREKTYYLPGTWVRYDIASVRGRWKIELIRDFSDWNRHWRKKGTVFLRVPESCGFLSLGEAAPHALDNTGSMRVTFDLGSAIAAGRPAMLPGELGFAYTVPVLATGKKPLPLSTLDEAALKEYPHLTYRTGYPDTEIDTVEEAMGWPVPELWRQYLTSPTILQTGCLDTDDYIDIYPPAQIVSLTRACADGGAHNPGYLHIAAAGGGDIAIDTRNPNGPTYLMYASEGWEYLQVQTNTLEEFVTQLESRTFKLRFDES